MTIDQPLDTVDMMLNMGPQHPSTHGVFRMVLTVDGENIVDVVPHIGYLHRGSEKLCEAEDYRQIIDLFDRLDYVSSFNNELPYVMAVEKLMGLEVPERAQYIRLIMCELNRIASHLLFYGAFGADCGSNHPVPVRVPGEGADAGPLRVGERCPDDARLLPRGRCFSGPA